MPAPRPRPSTSRTAAGARASSLELADPDQRDRVGVRELGLEVRLLKPGTGHGDPVELARHSSDALAVIGAEGRAVRGRVGRIEGRALVAQALLGGVGTVPRFGLLEKQEHLRFLLLHRTRSLTKKRYPRI